VTLNIHKYEPSQTAPKLGIIYKKSRVTGTGHPAIYRNDFRLFLEASAAYLTVYDARIAGEVSVVLVEESSEINRLFV